MSRVIAAGLALAFSLSAVAADRAHQHGVAALTLALEGGALLIEFESPLDSLVGFEHAPGNDAQRKAISDAAEALRAGGRLFALPQAAQCRLKDVQIEGPYDMAGGDAHDHASHEHEHEHEHEPHAGEAQADGAVHADAYAVWQFDCAVPERLETIGVGLFDVFPRLQRVQAELATPRGQQGVSLDRNNVQLRP